MSDSIIIPSVTSSKIIESTTDIQISHHKSYAQKMSDQIPKENIEKKWNSVYNFNKKEKFELINRLSSKLIYNNIFTSIDKSVNLVNLINDFFKKIQNIIFPENSENFVIENIEENEINNKLNEIIISIKNLKERLDELSKPKITEDFGINTEIKDLSKEIAPKQIIEVIKRISDDQNSNYDKLVKQNSELLIELKDNNKEIKKLKNEIMLFQKKLNKKKNFSSKKDNYLENDEQMSRTLIKRKPFKINNIKNIILNGENFSSKINKIINNNKNNNIISFRKNFVSPPKDNSQQFIFKRNIRISFKKKIEIIVVIIVLLIMLFQFIIMKNNKECKMKRLILIEYL